MGSGGGWSPPTRIPQSRRVVLCKFEDVRRVTSTGLGADYKLLFRRSRSAGFYLSIAGQGLSSNVPDAPPSPAPARLWEM